MNIGRQGHLAQTVQHFLKDTVAVETDDPSADVLHVVQHFAAEQTVPEGTDGPGTKPAAGADEGFPVCGVVPAQKENLHRNAGVFLHTEQTRGDDLGLVNDQGISRVEIINNIVEVLMLNLSVFPVVYQETAVIPRFHGGLGNQLFGKVVVEVGSFH